MSFLSLSHVSKIFKQTWAVEDFNLDVDQGEFISFLGPSGCGKTTTLRMVAGFEMPTSGTIRVNGEEITHLPPNQRNIGMVFQSYALFPNMTVGGNIGFGLRIAKKPSETVQSRIAEMLKLIHLPDFANRYPYQLSGGQQQRVALARALAIQPQLLLLDEPLSALDAKIRLELRSEIRRIQRELGITTIYVTHDQEEALSLSDRIVVLSAGKIEQIGSPFEIYNHPKTGFVATFVGQLNLIPVKILDPGNGLCDLGGQIIQIPSTNGTATGSIAQIALRPEEINLGQTEGHNNLTGTVHHLTFLGSIIRLHVRVGEALFTADLFNERTDPPPAIGEEIPIHFPVSACWLVD